MSDDPWGYRKVEAIDRLVERMGGDRDWRAEFEVSPLCGRPVVVDWPDGPFRGVHLMPCQLGPGHASRCDARSPRRAWRDHDCSVNGCDRPELVARWRPREPMRSAELFGPDATGVVDLGLSRDGERAVNDLRLFAEERFW